MKTRCLTHIAKINLTKSVRYIKTGFATNAYKIITGLCSQTMLDLTKTEEILIFYCLADEWSTENAI